MINLKDFRPVATSGAITMAHRVVEQISHWMRDQTLREVEKQLTRIVDKHGSPLKAMDIKRTTAPDGISHAVIVMRFGEPDPRNLHNG